jgi:predicted metal-dependent hydrolase
MTQLNGYCKSDGMNSALSLKMTELQNCLPIKKGGVDTFADQPIKIDRLVRSRRRTITLSILENGSLLVKAPLRMPLNEINAIVLEKSAWVQKKQKEISTRPLFMPKTFVAGERFLFLGREYPLQIFNHRSAHIELTDVLRISHKVLPHARERMEDWYRRQARRIFGERVSFYARQTGLHPASIRISGARKRWGSCGPNGSLNLSWRLVLAPLAILDYVVVHELVHLRIKNHSLSFKRSVRAIMADASLHEKWLKQNGHLLDF